MGLDRKRGGYAMVPLPSDGVSDSQRLPKVVESPRIAWLWAYVVLDIARHHPQLPNVAHHHHYGEKILCMHEI